MALRTTDREDSDEELDELVDDASEDVLDEECDELDEDSEELLDEELDELVDDASEDVLDDESDELDDDSEELLDEELDELVDDASEDELDDDAPEDDLDDASEDVLDEESDELVDEDLEDVLDEESDELVDEDLEDVLDEESDEFVDDASEDVLGDGSEDVLASGDVLDELLEELLDDASTEVVHKKSEAVLVEDSEELPDEELEEVLEDNLDQERSNRFGLLPAWILLPQIFLATGWLRAGVGHGMRNEWWSGQDLLDFADAQSSESILGYDLFLDDVVTSMPVAISVIVAILQVLVGLALLANWRPLGALAAGAFLNVNFMLAGVVNPSVFYLVLAGGILSWHLDRNLSSDVKAKLVKRLGPVALVSMIGLLFEIGSVHPESVTEDPASVMMFLLVLLVMMAWSLRDLDGVDEDEAIADTHVSGQRR